jgi:hypothetical protein
LEPMGASVPRVGLAVLLALPGALIVYFSFNSGGIFEVTTGLGALVVLVAMIVGLSVARKPLAGAAPGGLLACGLLALFALWTLLSADWSNATGRALVSLDRVLLYLAVLVLFACIPRSLDRFRWLLRGLLAASAAVVIIGLVSRLLPALWSTSPGLVSDRLSYPITYWNTFGLLVSIACILAVHHACDDREPPTIRICAAAALPLLGATLLLTFSRGAIAVTGLGVLAYVLIAHPRGLLGAVLAVGPTTAFAVSQTYSSDLVQEGTPLTPAAIAQGHDLALTIGACAVVAGLLRALALPLDARIRRVSISATSRRLGRIGAMGASVVILIAFTAAGGPSTAHHQYEKFVNDTHETHAADNGQRSRLLSVGNDGRLPLWRGALDAYRQDPLKGTGAGTYRLQSERHQHTIHDRVFAYSLYIETLGELGLVGIALLGAALLAILAGIAIRMREPGRPTYAAAFALVLAWMVHAGVDIDWQTPAVCVPAFALGGLALARPFGRVGAAGVSPTKDWRSRIPESIRASSPWARPVLALLGVAIATFPARMALAQTDLGKGIVLLSTGACDRAQSNAHDAISTIDTGARPYEVLAMCAARQRDSRAAVRWAKTAVSHDPENWEPHYVLALAKSFAGIDPRREAKIAHALNPLATQPERAVIALHGGSPARWKVVARILPLSMD